MNAIIRMDLSSRMKALEEKERCNRHDFKHFGINREIKKNPLYYPLSEFEEENEAFSLLFRFYQFREKIYIFPLMCATILYHL